VKVVRALLFGILLAVSTASSAHTVLAYAPQKGDSFGYSETTVVNNGQGSYTGYDDQLRTTGRQQVNSVSGNVVSASYSYSYQYNNNQGSSTSSSSSGNYTWSSSTFTYLNGTDNQVGFGGLSYSRPLYVWFAMNTSLPVGGTFFVLNSQFTVLSKNYTLQLPTQSKYVETIQAEGTGTFQRNDTYGLFTATYTWYTYFDPSTGYVVGYNYVEQDSGKYQGQAGSFTYSDSLYVTSTSYPLTPVSAPPGQTASSSGQGLTGPSPDIGYATLVVLFIGATAILAIYASRRRKAKDSLPKRSPGPYTPSYGTSPTPFQSTIDLGSKPPEQVVIRDVAKVNCRYCGTLIPSTVDRCPYCGGPRQ
jgi:hypothetical protein